MKNKFSLELCGDLEFEGMVIDVCYGPDSIVSMNYDKGIDQLEVELHAWPKTAPNLSFPLEDLLTTLEDAETLAVRCAKEDEERGKDEF